MEIMLLSWNEARFREKGKSMCKLTSRISSLRSAEGSSLLELAVIMPLLLFLLAAAVEFGWMIYVAIELSNAAQAGAIYGTLNPTDVSGISGAAQNGSSNLSGLSTSVTYGCECSDGSSPVPSCSSPPSCTNNYVNFVDVTATAPYSPFIWFQGLPASGSLSSEARLRIGGD
jgi:Flp pilus assembly protein TadG